MSLNARLKSFKGRLCLQTSPNAPLNVPKLTFSATPEAAEDMPVERVSESKVRRKGKRSSLVCFGAQLVHSYDTKQ